MNPPGKKISSLLLATIAVCYGDLYVYEPFDYQPHNDEAFGRLEGRNGGRGFAGPWVDTGGRGNEGYAFVYDERGNPEELYDGNWGQGKPNWDGKVDNLPTMGGYVGKSDWEGGGERLNSSRKLAWSAGEMAKNNRGVLWLSAAWHFPEPHYFAPVSIALTSNDGGIQDRAFGLTNLADGIGTGNGRNFRNGMKRLNPMIWENGKDVAQAVGTDIDSNKDNIVIMKFEFGETDKVSTWSFTEDQEMTEAAFNANAISCSYSIDEDTLDTLAFGTIRSGNAVDEIRIGTDFESVISGTMPERQEVKVVRFLYDEPSDRYYLEWKSNPGETYGIYLAEDVGGYKPCVAAAVEASDGERTAYGPFANPRPGNRNLSFEIGLPDLTPPTLDRGWGNGTTVSLHFSEPMLPPTALAPGNYAVVNEAGYRVEVVSAKFDPGNDTVRLTTVESLKPDTAYSITTRNLTDRANLPLVEPEISMRTWDDDPNGVKVFILAGQSNMIGRGNYDKGKGDEIGGVGSLREQIKKNSQKLGYLLDSNDDWKEIETMKFWWNRAEPDSGDPRIIKGNMTVGYGAGPDCIGPEYGFGWAVYQHYGDQPMLVIKAAWGGKSLHTDFCSPSAAATRDGRIGPYYLQMMESVRQVLHHLGEHFPEFEGKGYQIAGFGWHQGYNDMLSEVMTNTYEKNMVRFIRDIRDEFGKPKLPFSIATTGHGGMAVTPEDRPTLAGQLSVADPQKYPGFAGNVFTVDSRPFQRTVEESPRSDGSHWNNNGETLWLIGKGMGDGMVEMLGPKN